MEVFDILFFVVIIVILRSMIFGIILASFAQLREAEFKAQEEMSSKCFICSIERTEFDRKALGFDYHITHDHNMWNYLFFVVKVLETEPEYYTSMETHVADMIERNDIGWFPLHKAVSPQREPIP
jgi:inositol 1,4,5-triphosphate receptor type 1